MSPGSVADDPAQPNAVDEISIFFTAPDWLYLSFKQAYAAGFFSRNPAGRNKINKPKRLTKLTQF